MANYPPRHLQDSNFHNGVDRLIRSTKMTDGWTITASNFGAWTPVEPFAERTKRLSAETSFQEWSGSCGSVVRDPATGARCPDGPAVSCHKEVGECHTAVKTSRRSTTSSGGRPTPRSLQGIPIYVATRASRFCRHRFEAKPVPTWCFVCAGVVLGPIRHVGLFVCLGLSATVLALAVLDASCLAAKD
jgi:hypothetical protein